MDKSHTLVVQLVLVHTRIGAGRRWAESLMGVSQSTEASKGLFIWGFCVSSGTTLFILLSRATLKVYSDIYLMNVYIFVCSVNTDVRRI